jgi:hypothetical protein
MTYGRETRDMKKAGLYIEIFKSLMARYRFKALGTFYQLTLHR